MIHGLLFQVLHWGFIFSPAKRSWIFLGRDSRFEGFWKALEPVPKSFRIPVIIMGLPGRARHSPNSGIYPRIIRAFSWCYASSIPDCRGNGWAKRSPVSSIDGQVPYPDPREEPKRRSPNLGPQLLKGYRNPPLRDLPLNPKPKTLKP